MGSRELLQYFRTYDVVKVKHAYGPNGHRGMSLLIFEASAVGYLAAESLSNQFEDEGTGRENWVSRRTKFSAGAKRQLYGYLAEKGDMDVFNQHSHRTLIFTLRCFFFSIVLCVCEELYIFVVG